MQTRSIDWTQLGFNYIKTDYRYLTYWKDGRWQNGQLTQDSVLHISEGSTALHYGQQCFEGLKAYRCRDGSINLFRPQENAQRMQRSCSRLLMPSVPEALFLEACQQVVASNADFVPPFESGGTLYLRPFVIGVGDNIGVHSAPEFLFSIFAVPVGNYFKGDLKPAKLITTTFDRAAAEGTGSAKVGGNYAASLLPGSEAKSQGYDECLYLDPIHHQNIEEVGSANFFGITANNELIAAQSPSILPGITRKSILELAQTHLGLKSALRTISIDQLDEFVEAGACGTAAVITPIGSVTHKGRKTIIHSETEAGQTIKQLFTQLTGIQRGEIEPPEGWITKVNLNESVS